MITTSASGATPNLNDPIWTVEHIARCLHITVDTTREYTARDDFPAPRRLSPRGGRFLWPREEVLDWFQGLPTVPASSRRRGAEGILGSAAEQPSGTKAKSHSMYRRRSTTVRRPGGAA